jgi:hypothetical protein
MVNNNLILGAVLDDFRRRGNGKLPLKKRHIPCVNKGESNRFPPMMRPIHAETGHR